MRLWISGSTIWVATIVAMAAVLIRDGSFELEDAGALIVLALGMPLVFAALYRIAWWIGCGFKR